VKRAHPLGLAGLSAFLSLTLPAAPAIAGSVIVSGDDGKAARVDGGYKVDAHPVADTLVVLDAGSFPPHIVGQTEAHHSVSAPPTAVAVTPDHRIALLAAPNRVDAADPTKLVTEAFLQVIDVDGAKTHLLKRIDLPHQPISVAISKSGALALTVQAEGELSVLSISGRDVELVKTLQIGSPTSRTSGVAITPDQKWALVSYRNENAVGVLSIRGEEVAPPSYKIPTGRNPYAIEIAPNGRFAVVGDVSITNGHAEDSFTVIDLATKPFRVAAQISAPATPEGVAISPDSRWIAVSSINGSNAAASSAEFHDYGLIALYRVANGLPVATGTARTGHNAQGVVFTPDSKYLLVQDYMESDLSAFRVGPNGPVDTGVRVKMPGRPASIRSSVY
jgi:DNA-binding beta-propeller fold protein YncE